MPYDARLQRPEPFGLLNIRAQGEALERIVEMLGVELRRFPNSVEVRDEIAVLCLGPDEWLLRTPDGAKVRWLQALRSALEFCTAAVTDVSDVYVVFEISGRQVRDVLAQGAELDLHAKTFGIGRCARVRFAKTRVILHQTEASTFQLYVLRSYEAYLTGWLRSAQGSFRQCS